MQPTIESASQTNCAERRLQGSKRNPARLVYGVAKRLRSHGLVKKVGHTYKYYVTAFGKEVVTTALKLRELVIIPQLALGLAQ